MDLPWRFVSECKQRGNKNLNNETKKVIANTNGIIAYDQQNANSLLYSNSRSSVFNQISFTKII